MLFWQEQFVSRGAALDYGRYCFHHCVPTMMINGTLSMPGINKRSSPGCGKNSGEVFVCNDFSWCSVGPWISRSSYDHYIIYKYNWTEEVAEAPICNNRRSSFTINYQQQPLTTAISNCQEQAFMTLLTIRSILECIPPSRNPILVLDVSILEA